MVALTAMRLSEVFLPGANDLTVRVVHSQARVEYTVGKASGLLKDITMLQAGDLAPSFSLASDGGRQVDSATLKGSRYVLYFYPKDDTPGCTREACAFRDKLPAFDKLGVPVFGVSADQAKAHDKFVNKYSLNFPLLADPEHQLLEAYGVWVEKSLYGRKYFGIQRCTFVIDAKDRIEKVWQKVSPDSHAGEVLAYLAGEAAPAVPVAKATMKTAAVKTAAVKKAAVKKPAVKKAAAKKAAVKQAATRKAPAKKRVVATKASKKAPRRR
jgi:peroxiredoxin Q/BCP